MYEKLRKEIDRIKIVDDHAHPGLIMAMKELQMPAEAMFPFDDVYSHPSTQAYGFPYLEELHYEAYEKFYGFSREDIDDPDQKEILAARYEARKTADIKGLTEEIMAEAGVEYLMSNLCMPKALHESDRIGLVQSVDALLYPFDNSYLFGKPFGKLYLRQFEQYRELYRKEYHGKADMSYQEYMEFADRVLTGLKAAGSVSYKLISAYVRTTCFKKYEEALGETFYNQAKAGDHEAYTAFQDMMAWYIFRKAAILDMPIQVHMAMIDGDAEFTNPLNFTALTMDDIACKTKLVILHCAYPRFHEMTVLALAAKLFHKNCVYIDLSGRVMFGNHPRVIAKNIRNWLDYPGIWDKLVYGSDCLFGEWVIYTAARTARDAVYYALESALEDELFTEEVAIKLAKGILRNNAIDLYQLPLQKA